MRIKVLNSTNPLKSELHIRYCNGFFCRFMGLMFHPPLKDEDGIVLVYDRDNRMDTTIHMLFMRTDLSIIWVNSEMNVVDKVFAKRWRLSLIPDHPARYVLELSPSRFSEFIIGDYLDFVQCSI